MLSTTYYKDARGVWVRETRDSGGRIVSRSTSKERETLARVGKAARASARTK